MQEIFYEAAPYILAYPFLLEAYNTDSGRAGCTCPATRTGEQGAVLYSYNNIDTYRFVEPKRSVYGPGRDNEQLSNTAPTALYS